MTDKVAMPYIISKEIHIVHVSKNLKQLEKNKNNNKKNNNKYLIRKCVNAYINHMRTLRLLVFFFFRFLHPSPRDEGYIRSVKTFATPKGQPTKCKYS